MSTPGENLSERMYPITRAQKIQERQLNTHDHEKRSDLIFQAAFLIKKLWVENSPLMQHIQGSFQHEKCEILRSQSTTYPLATAPQTRPFGNRSNNSVKFSTDYPYFRP